MLSSNLWGLFCAEAFSAFAFALKGTAEPAILNDSIPNGRKKGTFFSKLDGWGVAKYYYIEAASSILAGILFSINGYIPMILTCVFLTIAMLIATRFSDIKIKQKEKKHTAKERYQEYFADLKDSFHFIIKSKRLKAILLFSCITWGLMCLLDNYEMSLLEDMNVSAVWIGVIFAVLGCLSGLASDKQEWFHKRYKNKVLTYIGCTYAGCCLIAGLIALFNIPFAITIVIVLITYGIRYGDCGLYNVLVKRYLGNFSQEEISTKLYSIDDLFSNIARMGIALIGSVLLTKMSTSYALILIGGAFTLIIMVISHYMKGKVGLKPEEYAKEDIEFQSIK